MLKTISLRNESVSTNDENILHLILDKLREDFIFIPLENFRIEVHEKDVEPIRLRLEEIKKELMQDDSGSRL